MNFRENEKVKNGKSKESAKKDCKRVEISGQKYLRAVAGKNRHVISKTLFRYSVISLFQKQHLFSLSRGLELLEAFYYLHMTRISKQGPLFDSKVAYVICKYCVYEYNCQCLITY